MGVLHSSLLSSFLTFEIQSGKTLMKLFEAAGVDLLLFDIQDVGVTSRCVLVPC
jgi:hypothetical protein